MGKEGLTDRSHNAEAAGTAFFGDEIDVGRVQPWPPCPPDRSGASASPAFSAASPGRRKNPALSVAPVAIA